MKEKNTVIPMMTQHIQSENDIYIAISKIKYLMKDLPFTESATQSVVVSLLEIGRNVLIHGGGSGHIECGYIEEGIYFKVSDRGPGIHNLEDILEGRFKSHTGLGLGLGGTRRLIDEVQIETSKKGTKIIAIQRYGTNKG